MRKDTLIKNFGSCAGEKKKLLKDCTEFALAAAEATDAGGPSVPDTVAVPCLSFTSVS